MNNKFTVYDLAYMAVGTVLIIVCSWISIPTVVPFTLQTFAVFFLLSFLGGKRGTLSILAYIILGAIGVPVFAGFTGGFGIIIGPTGGYIVGFIFMGLIYWLAEVVLKSRLTSTQLSFKNVASRVIVMLICLIICYAFGTAWFIVVYAKTAETVGLITALGWCVIPFIIPDLAKMGVAILIASRLRKHVRVGQRRPV